MNNSLYFRNRRQYKYEKVLAKIDEIERQRKDENKPEEGKVYALTGMTGTKSISNGNTWKESEVTI